jgi:mannose-1-phosphate guanylyltransferase/mannose-6-phosphate isomerase
MNQIQTIILCGGSGARLWPLSRESFPKQFIPLINGQSLLDLTLLRVASFGSPICITNEEHRFLLAASLKANLPRITNPQIILEPAGRNTAAAMAVGAHLPGVSDDQLLLFLPSDHFIPDINQFVETVKLGAAAAEAGYIVTYGVQPTFPSTAYGYIARGEGLIFSNSSEKIYKVQQFIEKPNIKKAQELFLSGNYAWNAGIFLCKAGVLRESLWRHAADIAQAVESAMKSPRTDGFFVRPDRDAFLACRSESIDFAVMELFDRVAMVSFNGLWSDVGSWNAVAQLLPADEVGNRINGSGYLFHSKNSYIWADHRPIVGLGLEDIVVVDSPDAILVAHSSSVEDLKQAVSVMKENNIPQAVLHRKVQRPWGWYDSIDMGENFKVKRILVKPGASLSLQLHQHRAEHWIVVKGTAEVTIENQVFFLKENQSTYIPIGAKHRLSNDGMEDLEMIEVQTGLYLGEDDIVRFEDAYGRHNL